MSLYTSEKNVLILISLMKQHGVRHVVASPGTTNTAFVGSIQSDPFFKIYSSVDERSAAYIACGISAEIEEPVAITCTGATASRNYISGMTEAYYRKLPVIAITSTQGVNKVGHNIAQVIDRSSIQNDIAKISVDLPIVKDSDDQWACEIEINKALLELTRNGGGPVHINLPTTYSVPFKIKELPTYRKISRIKINDKYPLLAGKIAIIVGAHKSFTDDETNAIDRFCSVNDAVVFCDHTSSYKGKYRLLFSLVAAQEMFDRQLFRPDVLIHIGDISGDYPLINIGSTHTWRVNPDGELRDTFRSLRYVFEMKELTFFEHYGIGNPKDDSYLNLCKSKLDDVRNKIPELPLSNIWVASQLSNKIPNGSVIHFGILNSLRSWNFFELDKSINAFSNVGGFGIDGCLSSLIGASLTNKDKLYFGVLGDLAFFYDMNSIGNRHVGTNLRILVINNGKGTEFRQYNHHAAYFGEDAESLIAAAGHYGNKSNKLIKNYAENLGFRYLSASNKQEFNLFKDEFVSEKKLNQSILFEIFTDSVEESKALHTILNIEYTNKGSVKKILKKLIGKNASSVVHKLLKR